MATTTSVCRSCLRAATRTQSHLRPQAQTVRQFTSTANRHLASKSKTKPAAPSPTPYNSAPPPPPPDSTFPNLAAQLRAAAPRSITEPYLAYGSTEDLFAECARQTDYTVPQTLTNPPTAPPQNAEGDHLGVGTGWWLSPKENQGLGLDPTFNSWAQVCMLHMYILTVRLRAFPKDVVQPWHQNLIDHFFYAAEEKMEKWHGMTSRHVRNKALKDLWTQWRGVQLGYDEGLIRGDAVLAAAVWRNVFKGREGLDLSDLERVTRYLRREIWRLGGVGDEVVYEGRVKFMDPREGWEEVRARTMGQGFGEEDLKALRESQGQGAEKR